MNEDRRRRLVALLAEREVDGIVVTTGVNVRYLTGFTGSNGALVLPVVGEPVFLTDGRYQDQAAAQVADLAREIGRDLLGMAAMKLTGTTWAVETHELSVDDHTRLATLAPTVGLVPGGRAVEALREQKDASEIAALRRACAISVAALTGLLEGPVAGRTEREIARALEGRMLDLGAEALAFDSIVAAGENSAIPHHAPTDRPIREGDLLKIDFGARVEGYHADCTRTVVVGRADDWQREIHAAVRASQRDGVAGCGAGAALATVDAAARDSLAESGWLHAFTTGLGHGVGLQIHEDPFVGAGHGGKLVPRTVLTIEPGIYVPGRGGVRIEDTVLITSGEPEVLTAMTTDLWEIT